MKCVSNKQTQTVECSCGGHYINVPADRKQHENTKMHKNTAKSVPAIEIAPQKTASIEMVHKGYNITITPEEGGFKYDIWQTPGAVEKSGKSATQEGALKNAKKTIARI